MKYSVLRSGRKGSSMTKTTRRTTRARRRRPRATHPPGLDPRAATTARHMLTLRIDQASVRQAKRLQRMLEGTGLGPMLAEVYRRALHLGLEALEAEWTKRKVA